MTDADSRTDTNFEMLRDLSRKTFGYFRQLLVTYVYSWLLWAIFATLGYFWRLFGYFQLLARLPAAPPLDGDFEMEEGGHMEGMWVQLYPHSSPSLDPEAEDVQARPGQDYQLCLQGV